MQLVIRFSFFIAALALVVTAPWYGALAVVASALVLTGWYELLALALVIDVLMGAGVQLSAVPIATLCGSAIILARTLMIPYLFSMHSPLHL